MICSNGAPWGKPMVPKRHLQGANIPYQRTNSLTGRTRGPLGSGEKKMGKDENPSPLLLKE